MKIFSRLKGFIQDKGKPQAAATGESPSGEKPEGKEHIRIGPTELATNGALLDVRIDIAATDPINREVKLQKDMNLLGLFMQLYGDPNHPVVMALIKRIAELGDLPISPEMLQVRPNPENVEASGGPPGSPPGEGGAQGAVSSALTGSTQLA